MCENTEGVNPEPRECGSVRDLQKQAANKRVQVLYLGGDRRNRGGAQGRAGGHKGVSADGYTVGDCAQPRWGPLRNCRVCLEIVPVRGK